MRGNQSDISKNFSIVFMKSMIVFLLLSLNLRAQENLNNRLDLFDLSEVSLHDNIFKHAREVDLEYMLKLDPNRLLAPFLREAGLVPKAENYPNWENTGLDGHIAGHYLTTLAQMYASTGNEEVLGRLKYMLKELRKVQEANGNGYIGGVPGSKKLWEEITNGIIDAGSFSLNDKWVPLYNIHKTFAGLRDAYLIAGLQEVKPMLIDFTDWMLKVTKNLSNEQVQEILKSEYGGLNEVFADVAEITGEKKYLDLAYRFSQKSLLQPLESETDILNGMHANTQIPKVIGFEKIAEIDDNQEYHNSAKYFWNNVVNDRTVAIGGNSVREHFNPKDDFSTMISSVQGPETCNTYNMIKLSKMLFLAEADEKYIDYYEQALYNHILSSQNPETGGFVYFTPMRPGHYRVYSKPETSFWCCVGSGLENHTKYNELIYAHNDKELFVNLFISSTLGWKDKGFKLVQNTSFPEEASTSFLIGTGAPLKLDLKIRYPKWVAYGELEVQVNGRSIKIDGNPGGYFSINRTWKNGDSIKMKMPMKLNFVRLPDGSDYKALMYGPIVLAAKTGKDNLEGLYADASRGGHIASGKTIPLTDMPYFLSDKTEDIEKFVKKIPGEKLRFSASEVLYPAKYKNLEFIPFYELHNSRYVIYLPINSFDEIQKINEKLKKQEKAERILDSLTIDRVSPGEQQPEADHFIESENSNIGVHQNRHWRDADGWFSYRLVDKENEAHQLRITYFGEDRDRKFKILLNGQLLAKENFRGTGEDRFFDKDYTIPPRILEKSSRELTLRFEALPGSRTAGIYGVRLMKQNTCQNE
jgi:hypothetical protein